MMMKQQQQQQQQQSESKPSSMRKICIEVCLISARGLPRSSLWKHHWFAVGWIDPNNKYCTKIDSSGNPNPVWKTKFTSVVDLSESDFHDLALCLEVYSRDPIFLGEKLRGTATVSLKEFLAKYGNNSEGSNYGNEEVGSFQLRKKYSDKPQGFIDVSIRISEESEGPTSSYAYLGSEEGFNLNDVGRNGINLATEAGPMQAYPTGHTGEPTFQLQGKTRPPVHYPYLHPVPYPTNYPNPSVGGPSYPPTNGSSAYPPPPGPPRTPPPPPPPSNVGYIPTFLPRTDNQPTMYMNMPSSGGGAGRGAGPGFGVGLGAGALAAGAVIFGDDFMSSGFQLPAGMRSDPSIIISTDSPF